MATKQHFVFHAKVAEICTIKILTNEDYTEHVIVIYAK